MSNLSSSQKLLLATLALLIGIPALGVVGSMVGKKGPANQLMMRQAQDAAMPSSSVTMGQGEGMMNRMEYSSGAAPAIAPMPPEYSDPGAFTPTEDRLYIKNAWLSLEVKEPQETSKTVTQLAQSKGGVVTNLQMDTYQQNQGIVTANMTVRIPVANLDSFIEETKKLAKTVLSEQLSVDDATERAVDIDAQLTNLRATETQLLTIMAQAKTVEDTLRVQQELTNTRDRIERLQAQRDSLTGAAAMSTVQLTLTTDAGELPVINDREPSIKEEIKNTIRDAIQIYRALFVAGLKLVILASPLLIIGVIAWFFVRKKPTIAKK
jgi:hypothetical protein